jgi:hypothetical protein
VPGHLQKYRKDQVGTTKSNKNTTVGPGADIDTSAPANASLAPKRSNVLGKTVKAPTERSTIYAIDNQTFRFLVPEKSVWDSALNVLLRNYNLNIVDKESGVITTEWDTFYLNNSIFRNKISLRVQKNAGSSVDVMIHNSVEKLQEGTNGAAAAIWLPSEDSAEETQRVVQNMAVVLNEPAPVMPRGMTVQRSYDKPRATR